jgi:hypothetical protein
MAQGIVDHTDQLHIAQCSERAANCFYDMTDYSSAKAEITKAILRSAQPEFFRMRARVDLALHDAQLQRDDLKQAQELIEKNRTSKLEPGQKS